VGDSSGAQRADAIFDAYDNHTPFVVSQEIAYDLNHGGGLSIFPKMLADIADKVIDDLTVWQT
jgi:hypothetical protein